MLSPGLSDGFSRTFHYLRLSVTEVCNFACGYCLPNGHEKVTGAAPELSRAEIVRLVRGFAALGLWKVRITGGEPATRADLADVIRDVAAVPGVRRVALSTNGYRLEDLVGAGFAQVNVSIDSLDSATFARVTGRDQLAAVLRGVDAALARGIVVKVNAVLLPDTDVTAFAEWVRDRPVVVRFIELMQTGDNVAYFRRHHTRADALRARLRSDGWVQRPRAIGDGPAEEYRREGFRGGLGVIAAYSPGFCETCNRLRVSSRGRLRLCLFGDGDHDLRPLLQDDADLPALANAVRSALGQKAEGHRLREGIPGDMPRLAVIGG